MCRMAPWETCKCPSLIVNRHEEDRVFVVVCAGFGDPQVALSLTAAAWQAKEAPVRLAIVYGHVAGASQWTASTGCAHTIKDLTSGQARAQLGCRSAGRYVCGMVPGSTLSLPTSNADAANAPKARR